MIRSIASFLDTSGLPHTKANSDNLTNIFNIVLGVVGALAFFMLVVAGFRYTISQGDSTKIADAKRMMIYSIVGLVVIALAATIVNFVLDRL